MTTERLFLLIYRFVLYDTKDYIIKNSLFINLKFTNETLVNAIAFSFLL